MINQIIQSQCNYIYIYTIYIELNIILEFVNTLIYDFSN